MFIIKFAVFIYCFLFLSCDATAAAIVRNLPLLCHAHIPPACLPAFCIFFYLFICFRCISRRNRIWLGCGWKSVNVAAGGFHMAAYAGLPACQPACCCCCRCPQHSFTFVLSAIRWGCVCVCVRVLRCVINKIIKEMPPASPVPLSHREREWKQARSVRAQQRESEWVLIWVQLRERERVVRAFCAIHAKDTENICCRCRLRCWRRCLRPVFVFALCFCFLLIFLYTIFM